MNKLADNAATVLIVNDDQMQLDRLRGLLEPEGYQTFVAQDGQRALEIIRTSRIDIIISNVVMPEMNGMELWRRLKKDPHTATIPLLLAGGIPREDWPLLDSVHAGADGTHYLLDAEADRQRRAPACGRVQAAQRLRGRL